MEISNQLDPPEVLRLESREEKALLACHLAKQHEDRGEYEEAHLQLTLFWPTFDGYPDLTGLSPIIKGHLLRRVGTLTGWLGRVYQLPRAQEKANNLLTQSLEIFQHLSVRLEVVETNYELALCYWREGAFEEARIIINLALSLLTESDEYWEGKLLQRAAVIEFDKQNLQEALRLFRRAESKIENSNDVLLKGKLHSELGLALRRLFLQEETVEAKNDGISSDYNKQYLQFALNEYTKAGELFEQASHKRYVAYVENNIGYLYFSQGHYDEAHKFLDMALQRLEDLKDHGNASQVIESIARVYLAQGELEKALMAAQTAVDTFKHGDDRALLSEALVTLGKIYVRQGQSVRAKETLTQAIETSELSGDLEGAGSAALTLIEELFDHLTDDDRQDIYLQAEKFLFRPMNPVNATRLREMSLSIIRAEASEPKTPHGIIIYPSSKLSHLTMELASQ